MGTDCAPLLANLFLFFYEYRYMKSLIKNNIFMARRFNNTMRYIDDQITPILMMSIQDILLIFSSRKPPRAQLPFPT